MCRSDTGATYPAYFIKVSLVLCKVPKRSTPGISYLEVTIDSVRYSINQVSVEFIDPPSITAIDLTTYYFTKDETVNINLVGTNLDKNTDYGGILFVKVDNVVNVYPVSTG